MPRSLALFLFLSTSLAAQEFAELPNPLERAHPGDWAEYRMRTRLLDPAGHENVYDTRVRQTVLAVTADEIRVESKYTAFEQTWSATWTVRRGASWWEAFRAELAAEGLVVELAQGTVGPSEVAVLERTHPGRRIVVRFRGEQEVTDRSGRSRTQRSDFDLVVLATDAVPVTGRVRTELAVDVEGPGGEHHVVTELEEFGGE